MANDRVNHFIDDFGEAVTTGSAGLFVGAGLSIRAGYPSWRTLLRGVARELGLSENEPDLIAVAQYHLNENLGNEGSLTRELVRLLGDDRPLTSAHRSIARLAIDTVWTTNYDRMLERAYASVGKRVAIKSRQSQLRLFDRRVDATIFKMHGSVDDPTDLVIAREHYELYGKSRELFQNLLLTDLVRRTFLFIGLSFNDPNLLNLFGMVRARFEHGTPPHWALMLPTRPDPDEDARIFARRNELFITDLRRYGLEVLKVEDDAVTDDLLRRLESKVARRTVLVSGSLTPSPNNSDERRIRAIAQSVGRVLADYQLTLVTGFGLVIGSEVISGFLEHAYDDLTKPLPRMIARPFPQTAEEPIIQQYRRDLVNQAGMMIVIAGLKDGEIAKGVLDEAAIARDNGRPVIPIGTSGGAAERLWREMVDSPEAQIDRGAYERLGAEGSSVEEITRALEVIIRKLLA